MATFPARPSARRRQRSTRLTVAVVLLVTAALLVTGGVVSGSFVLISVAAVAAVALGAAATRITHAELAQSRRDAARDRAEQAQEYAALTERRTTENAQFVHAMNTRIADRESTIERLEDGLSKARKRALEVTRKMNTEARRADIAEERGKVTAAELDGAQDRAAEAIVQVAELELEIDVLRAELGAWQTAAEQPLRRHG